MGAVVNMRPDLWCAVVMGVPFVDVVTTMLDPTIPLTVIEVRPQPHIHLFAEAHTVFPVDRCWVCNSKHIGLRVLASWHCGCLADCYGQC